MIHYVLAFLYGIAVIFTPFLGVIIGRYFNFSGGEYFSLFFACLVLMVLLGTFCVYHLQFIFEGDK